MRRFPPLISKPTCAIAICCCSTLEAVAGHIPGAINRPFRDNLTADGRFKPAEQLERELKEVLQGRPAKQVVAYCGSGITACHNLLALEIAGLRGARLY